QTNFLVNDNQHREMQERPHVGTRMDPVAGYPMKITIDDGSCTWAAAGRTVVRRGDTWTITGEHAGVDLNLVVTATREPEWYKGPWENVAAVGVAGSSLLCRVTGTFSHGGDTYTITDGWAVRERALFGNGWDVVSNLHRTTKRNYFWNWVFTEELQMFFYEQAGSTGGAAHVYLKDGSIIHYDETETNAVITKQWVDPMVRDRMATAIKIHMSSDQGTLEVDAQTWARSLFGFHPKNGYTIHSGAIGRATGQFTRPDGSVLAINEATSYIEQGYAVMLPAV
ncbi:MAG: hypothetical protein JWL70_2630, partial [Acidimicrobiia bacterium]|nr:hypothetical protein [Acidimicrobiia bacterium]